MSSSISSPPEAGGRPGSPPPSRDHFALTGKSRPYDPLTTPARRDLADVALAGSIFAPHYARALATRALVETPLLAGNADDAATLTTLAPGDRFRVLELAQRFAWGQIGDNGLVGYVDRHALEAER